MEPGDTTSPRGTDQSLQTQGEMLAAALMTEYEAVINLVRYYDDMPTLEMSQRLMKLVADSMQHAEFTMSVLTQVGVTVPPIVINPSGKTDLSQALSRQVEVERLMAWLYGKLGEGVSDPALKTQFAAIVQAEHGHVSTVEDLLSTLRSP